MLSSRLESGSTDLVAHTLRHRVFLEVPYASFYSIGTIDSLRFVRTRREDPAIVETQASHFTRLYAHPYICHSFLKQISFTVSKRAMIPKEVFLPTEAVSRGT